MLSFGQLLIISIDVSLNSCEIWCFVIVDEFGKTFRMAFSASFNEKQLYEWLSSKDNSIEDSAKLLLVERIDGPAFLGLTKEDLVDLKLPFGHRKKVGCMFHVGGIAVLHTGVKANNTNVGDE